MHKDTWLPDETIDALKEYVVSIKGPLTTPIGGGIRSLKCLIKTDFRSYTFV